MIIDIFDILSSDRFGGGGGGNWLILVFTVIVFFILRIVLISYIYNNGYYKYVYKC